MTNMFAAIATASSTSISRIAAVIKRLAIAHEISVANVHEANPFPMAVVAAAMAIAMDVAMMIAETMIAVMIAVVMVIVKGVETAAACVFLAPLVAAAVVVTGVVMTVKAVAHVKAVVTETVKAVVRATAVVIVTVKAVAIRVAVAVAM